ncbi:putative D,D-dipeptide transport ATP-binding protein DdpD [Ruminiclostridium hungatei]|uniref:Putative D,D-dipeptide transport ATP-binding protein DdpD n=1 Tax=Ruminiclostridium hungatei TaxID=48256 RepID=A0A1V4SN81_RUMHU|nr:ABC transporter ATP-binding protein [Ruminiclostridium hungatei]OPX44925.1 putative D,D-dipeptide transport ATP-binding protein DdpD [Ruminiclostridium hungatei]
MPLNVRNLKISFTSGESVTEEISFKIEKGEMLAVVGSSGAGKTTVCRAIMGLLGADFKAEGTVCFNDTELLNAPEEQVRKIYGKEICFIMQNPMTAFNPSIPVGRQMVKTYQKHNAKLPRAEITAKCEEAMHSLGLTDTKRILKSYPFELSGGMLQRVMIATALVNKPQMLVADEATTAIDACNRIELMRELKKLCKQGMSILFVTHDLSAAANSDKMLVMDKGRVIEAGRTADILNNSREEYTRDFLNAAV